MTDIALGNALDTADRFRKRTKKRLTLLALGLLVLIVSLLADISWGPSDLSIYDAAMTILNPSGASPQMNVIVWDIRLPIAIMAVLVGAMLGVAGAEMQTILNNPLADPFTLGISSAAAFGAALAIVFRLNLVPGAGEILVTTNAFVLALFSSFILYAFTKIRGVTSETMALATADSGKK